MSAADAREELEAAIRRQLTLTQLPGRGRPTHNQVTDLILTYADAYASACVATRQRIADTIDGPARQRRLAAAEASAAEHRERLEQAIARRARRPA
jgi:hypothetical protein